MVVVFVLAYRLVVRRSALSAARCPLRLGCVPKVAPGWSARVSGEPCVYVGGVPDQAAGQLGGRRGEVGISGADLVEALAGYAEARCKFGGAHVSTVYRHTRHFNCGY